MIRQIYIQRITKVFALFALALIIMVTFTGCSIGYKADSIKNKLTNAGYTVEEMQNFEFTDGADTSTFTGLIKIFSVTKDAGDDAEAGILIIFDSTDNAKQITNEYFSDLHDNVIVNCGANKKDGIISAGFNNVVLVGYFEIRDKSGLNSNPLFSMF